MKWLKYPKNKPKEGKLVEFKRDSHTFPGTSEFGLIQGESWNLQPYMNTKLIIQDYNGIMVRYFENLKYRVITEKEMIAFL